MARLVDYEEATKDLCVAFIDDQGYKLRIVRGFHLESFNLTIDSAEQELEALLAAVRALKIRCDL